MKRLKGRTGNQSTNGGSRSRIITLANMIEVCRVDPSDGRKGQGPAGEGRPIGRSSAKDRLIQQSPIPPWADAATRCLNAYIQRDYSACVTAGCEALSHQLIPTVGLVTILALRREGRLEEAEGFGRALLRCGVGPGGILLLLLMLLDGALNPEQFLKERFFAGFRVGASQELDCQVYFYWGAKLLTEGKVTTALGPLRLCIGMQCSSLERNLADADLAVAQGLLSKVN